MRQNATPDEVDLSPQQRLAIESLVAGETMTAAAKAGGVTRQTVHLWQREKAAFQATLNRARNELAAAMENTASRSSPIGL